MKNNKIRVDKDMVTENPEGVEVVHFHGKNDFEETLWVATEIKEIVKTENASYSDITILYRSNHLSRNIEQALIKDNIPYIIFGGVRFFERKEIKDVLSFLRLIVQGDNFSFLRLFNHPTRGLGKKFIERLSLLAGEQNLSLLEALERNVQDKELHKKGALDFLSLVAELKKDADTDSISDLVKIILDKSGLSELYRKDGDEDRLENIKELVSSMLLLEKENNGPVNIVEYLQEVALYTDLDKDTENQDKVRLMTIHISKGLEFPYVFLCGFTEGVLPSALSIKERRKRAIEEERRLMYVAVTRAEKRFYMTDSEGFNFTTGLNKYPSRFLFEIKEEFYVRKGKLSAGILQNAQTSAAAKTLEDTAFSVGDLVLHPVWNTGQIQHVDREKNQYSVHFFEMGKEKPIDFAFRFLTAASDGHQGSSPAELLSFQESLKTAPDPFQDEEQSSAEADAVFKNEDRTDRFDNDTEKEDPEKKWYKPWK
ncbi:ATP-dependent helicase [Flavobacterium olei]|uniref:ATP-dependent helicase n=1 Tax=Flavobacterium olei TaxID=1886782 RepID=UPI00321AE296